MAQDLPDDVWSEIAEVGTREDLRNMSLTSRRMRRLTLPELFRCLDFHMSIGARERWVPSIMVMLIRNIIRARSLFDSPELLRHTRVFNVSDGLCTVDAIAEYFELYADSSSSGDDAEKFLAVLHDTIFRLIFRMPGLREVDLSNDITMTPLCYAAISSRPLLTSLRLETRYNPGITRVAPPVLPYTRRLRDLICPTLTTDPYIIDILGHSILDLEELTIPLILLPLVVSRIPLHHTLPLQALTVVFLANHESSVVAAFFLVLRASPRLRHLHIPWNFPHVEPTHYLPPPSLPNLTTFYGTCRLLPILSGAKSLVKIEINDKIYINEQLLTPLILSPPPQLRELFMASVVFSQTPQELLTFIRSLAVFRNLERLYLVYGNDMSWKDHVSVQDSHRTIKDLLRQLPCLRFFHIAPVYGTALKSYDIGCPISKQGEPADRGHPSLEHIYVDFICGMWNWDSRTGWRETD